ncbi:hypothetical protein NDU88_005575 [Pleurodeles waltl]|uniref:Uncharacterized protein n=1 Tax=Pleurodeles waltl TaxID=8319 RepID=A0AAV7SM72_PLEWA|nr:hypothetical protein NDU88_005575 [Pleurodeles waltl]
MEPELQILPAFIFLLLYLEQQRRRRRPHLSSVGIFGAHWPAVLVAAVSLAAVLVAAVSCSAVLMAAVPLAAVLVAAVSLAAVLVAVLSTVQVFADLPVLLARPLGQVRRWRHPPVYRPLVDLSTMEERHVIITYRLDRTTILELCAQLEPDPMSGIRHPTGIPPQVQVEDLPTVKVEFYALGHIPNIIGAIDGTHVALVPPQE